MAEWNFVVMAGELKSAQEEIVGVLTEIQDVFLKLQDEAGILSDQWKGHAADTFFQSFGEEWEEAWQDIQRFGKIIAMLNWVEEEIEESEKKVQEILSLKGAWRGWRI